MSDEADCAVAVAASTPASARDWRMVGGDFSSVTTNVHSFLKV